MSRTLKDKPSKLKEPWDKDMVREGYANWIYLPTTKTKKRKKAKNGKS